MRTQEEILKRIEARKEHNCLGSEIHEYIYYLDYEHAKSFLKDGIKGEDWEQDRKEKKTPAEMIKDYMSFAWDKANNCRGISAARSIMHMIAWLWMDGQDVFLKKWNELKDYEYYGKPQLIAICELYGIDWKQWDDGVRTNMG